MPPSIHPDRILMVYNADEGFFNALNDWAHKIVSPETYDCRLCHYTYGVIGMLGPWKTFLDHQPFPTLFYHRLKFKRAYPEYAEVALPLILVEKDGQVDVLLLADEIADSGGLTSLIDLIQARLAVWRPMGAGPGSEVN